MDKAEYVRQLKQLIKKYHPDLCRDSFIESVYNEITKKLVNKLNELKSKENRETQNIKNDNEYGLVKRKSQDYCYYKSGIKFYRNIHPNQFYKRNIDTTFETKTYQELVLILNKIYLSFNLSEHYFKKVIDEYPNSQYLEDSKSKLKLLKKLHKSYKNAAFEENKIINNEKFMNDMELKIM